MAKILFLITEDWYFLSHRLLIAERAVKEGFEVAVATRINKNSDNICNHGFKVIPITMKRSDKNIIKEIKALLEIIGIYLREKPDIVHHVAVKPVLYGSFASMLFKNIRCVNAIAGLGYVFSRSDTLKTRLIRKIFLAAYWIAFLPRFSHVIFQNPEDRNMFIKNKIITNKRSVLIPGSGVDITKFRPETEPGGSIIIMLASRMLWDKGIGELVAATKILKSKGFDFKTILVGIPDMENPDSIPVHVLERWHNENIVEWWGFKKNMEKILNLSHIVALPSYREGLPKVLIEAAACGKPLVATDVPGCREIVHHGRNGFLVPLKNEKSLADAMEKLIKDPLLREKMGRASRQMAEKYFTSEIVVNKTINLYKQVLAST